MNKFANACQLSYDEWSSTLPNIEQLPTPIYSKRHIKKMNNLFDKMRGDTYHRFTRKTIKVMIVAAIIVALMLSAFAIPSSRKFFLESFNTFSTLKITEHNANSVQDEILVGYLPEGYELHSTENHSKNTIRTYISKNGDILSISKCSSSVELSFDTESGATESKTVNGTKYLLYTNGNNINGILFIKNDYIYHIEGNLYIDEFIKVAENLK